MDNTREVWAVMSIKLRLKVSYIAMLVIPIILSMLVIGCGKTADTNTNRGETMESNETGDQKDIEKTTVITPTSEIVKLEDGLSSVRYDGDYGFDQFLKNGGASSDSKVMNFLTQNLLSKANRYNSFWLVFLKRRSGYGISLD